MLFFCWFKTRGLYSLILYEDKIISGGLFPSLANIWMNWLFASTGISWMNKNVCSKQDTLQQHTAPGPLCALLCQHTKSVSLFCHSSLFLGICCTCKTLEMVKNTACWIGTVVTTMRRGRYDRRRRRRRKDFPAAAEPLPSPVPCSGIGHAVIAKQEIS